MSMILYTANSRSKFLLTGFVPIFFLSNFFETLVSDFVVKNWKNDRETLLSIEGTLSLFSGGELAKLFSKGVHGNKNIMNAFIACKNHDFGTKSSRSVVILSTRTLVTLLQHICH